MPSVVFPGKIEVINQLTFNSAAESPLGGKSLIVNLYFNFGMFYPIYLIAIGSYFGFLSKKASSSVFYRATYFSALPLLLFLFFREGLITVVKVMFFNGLIVPLVVSLLMIELSSRPLTRPRSVEYSKACEAKDQAEKSLTYYGKSPTPMGLAIPPSCQLCAAVESHVAAVTLGVAQKM